MTIKAINSKYSFAICLFILAILIFGHVSVYCQNQENEKLIEYVVAKVNNTIITSTELQAAVDNLKARMKDAKVDEITIRKEVLENLIIEKLVTTIAQIYKVEVSDEDINQRIELIKKDNKIETDDELNNALKAQGITLQWLKEQLKRGFLYQRVILSNVYATITVSDQEVLDYYNRNIREYSSGEEARIRQIFISTSDKDEAAALSSINEAYEKLKQGMDFISVLNQYSDENTRINGGDIGYFKKGELVGALEEAASKLQLGDYSDVIKTNNGYHIIQVTERKIAKEIPLESVRQEITEKIRTSKLEAASKVYIEKLKKDYFVEILDPSLKPKEEHNPEGNE
jgi:parvulin-like peptidyl-prolyl isomerase